MKFYSCSYGEIYHIKLCESCVCELCVTAPAAALLADYETTITSLLFLEHLHAPVSSTSPSIFASHVSHCSTSPLLSPPGEVSHNEKTSAL